MTNCAISWMSVLWSTAGEEFKIFHPTFQLFFYIGWHIFNLSCTRTSRYTNVIEQLYFLQTNCANHHQAFLHKLATSAWFHYFRYKRTNHITGFIIANTFSSTLINCILLLFFLIHCQLSFSFICTPTNLKIVRYFASSCCFNLYSFCTDTTSLHIKQTSWLLHFTHTQIFFCPSAAEAAIFIFYFTFFTSVFTMCYFS